MSNTKILRFQITCGIQLDLERAEEDPIFIHFLGRIGENHLDEVMKAYLAHYLKDEHLLQEMPSTNGPADMYLINSIDVIEPGAPKEKLNA